MSYECGYGEIDAKAVEVELTQTELAELDAATKLPPVYPNWFIDRLADEAVATAIGVRSPR